MKHINVSCAIIIRDNNGIKELYATERGYGTYKGWWEFPGGKLEEGETGEEAIVREIKEELDTTLKVEANLGTVEYQYPEFFLTMHCFLCSIVEGSLTLLEHSDATWLTKDTLHSLKWLPADEIIFPEVEKYL